MVYLALIFKLIVSNKIEIPQEDIKPYIEFLDSKRAQKVAELEIKFGEVQVLQTEVKYYERKINELKDLDITGGSIKLAATNDAPKADTKQTSVYSTQWGWAQKIKFSLDVAKHPLTTSEIMDILQAYEPGIKEKARSVSAILSDRIKEGTEFTKVVDANSSYPKYALITWDIAPQSPKEVISINATYATSDGGQIKQKRHYTPRGLKGSGINSKVYDKSWTLAKKAEFAVREIGHLSTTRDMIEIIAKCEPHFMKEKGWTFGRFQKNIGSTLLQKIKARKVFERLQMEGGEYLYGMKDWFISDNKVKDQYLPISETQANTNGQVAGFMNHLITNVFNKK